MSDSLEGITKQVETIYETAISISEIEQEEVEDVAVMSADGGKENLEEDTAVKQSGIQGVPCRLSTEAERLKQVFESKQSDTDDADELNLDADDPAEDNGDFSDINQADMAESDKLPSQADPEGRETEEAPSGIEDETKTSDEEGEGEALTPKTAKTPRKRRNLLMSYLSNKKFFSLISCEFWGFSFYNIN
jgi:hypothetical protein